MKRYPKGTWMKLRSPEILQAFMRQKDFSMSRLARYAGCSKSMIGHLCKGHKKSCGPELADRIAEALDVPTEALFDLRASAASGRYATSERIAS
jgi:transcriptional regulator with XRE-family HTH domain